MEKEIERLWENKVMSNVCKICCGENNNGYQGT